ncbi:MAG: hypothetical protein HKL80_07860 [Acidimicrobiales bacterium]|nr:hypothetical protein [Acidimicrobiales bacterium]
MPESSQEILEKIQALACHSMDRSVHQRLSGYYKSGMSPKLLLIEFNYLP